ncbi:adenine-specific methyltransferase EcoRI family protein [Candidatus Dojkabacteria bacterium]|nr:adenine-specific methyltransferase EcoRI family protein [Candidatus Dojkabacteria bacterium]
MAREGANKYMQQAKRSKNDEFYTQFSDIQKEIEAYLEYDPDTFKNKVIYSNCDDPYESNFFRYFVLNFNKLGLKRLVTTSYKPSPVANTQLKMLGDDKTLGQSKGRPKITANKIVINEVGDIDGDGEFNLKDVAEQLKANKNNDWEPLEGNGDFRSKECVTLLKQSDIVVTNPPFSLFREYVQQLFDYKKQFLIIGNINCITYKEVFPKIKSNEAWLGNGMGRWISGFIVPKSYDLYGTEARIDENGNRIVSTNNCLWLTNLDHGRRHQPLSLMTMADNKRFNKKIAKNENSYKKYDNYDVIEVPYTDAIPSDYNGVMGVPVTFLDKYNPEQFELIGMAEDNGRGYSGGVMIDPKGNPHATVPSGKHMYKRIFIKHKK